MTQINGVQRLKNEIQQALKGGGSRRSPYFSGVDPRV